MAYAAGTAKVIIGGTCAGGEAFAFGYQVRLPGGSAQFALTNLNGSAAAALQNNFLTTAVKLLFPTTTVFRTVRSYLYTGGPTAAYTAAAAFTAIPGNSSTVSLPTQNALVVSLETGIPGRSNRGRAYLPPLIQANFTPTAQLDSATCTTLANAFAAMLTAVNATSTVASKVVVASATKGSSTDVTNVRVDSLMDTQRRRRNKLVPAASIAATL